MLRIRRKEVGPSKTCRAIHSHCKSLVLHTATPNTALPPRTNTQAKHHPKNLKMDLKRTRDQQPLPHRPDSIPHNTTCTRTYEALSTDTCTLKTSTCNPPASGYCHLTKGTCVLTKAHEKRSTGCKQSSKQSYPLLYELTHPHHTQPAPHPHAAHAAR